MWAVEAVFWRLLFQFKYMPTRDVIKQRLEANNHEESSTVMQNNDLVTDQHGGKILPNFSSVLIVTK